MNRQASWLTASLGLCILGLTLAFPGSALAEREKFPTEIVGPIAAPSMVTVEAVGLPFSGASTASPFQRTVRKVGGSGFLVTSDGYIITSAHTVQDAEYLNVTIEGKKYEAKFICDDEFYEIALLKIDDPDARGKHWTPVKWGSSGAMRVGNPVVVIGSPASLDRTMTYGFVTNVRDVRMVGPGGRSTGVLVPACLEMDAAIVPANYGGPTFNAAGQVVGIVNRYTAPETNQQDMNYALPSDVMKPIVDQLVAKGRAFHPWFGVEPYANYSNDKNLAIYLGVPTREINPETGQSYGIVGVLVDRVAELSPAAEAGLIKGDLILKFNGKLVRDTKDLELAVLGLHAGESFTLTIVRNGKVSSKRITIADRPTTKEQQERDIRLLFYGI
ncbi:MAG: trypsin-like peptidase domain-containing protein [bacterium]